MDTQFNIERCAFSGGVAQLTVYVNEQMHPSVRYIIEDSTLDENAKKEKEYALLKFELLDMKAHVEDLSTAIGLAEQKPKFVASTLLQTMPKLRSDLVLFTECGEDLLAESYGDQSPSENSLLSAMQLITRRLHLSARLKLFNTLKQACLSRQSSLQTTLQLMSASPGNASKQITSIYNILPRQQATADVSGQRIAQMLSDSIRSNVFPEKNGQVHHTNDVTGRYLPLRTSLAKIVTWYSRQTFMAPNISTPNSHAGPSTSIYGEELTDRTARDTQLSSPFSKSPWCLLNYASPVCSTEPETIDDLVADLEDSAQIEEVESSDDEVSPTEQAAERRWLAIARTSA